MHNGDVAPMPSQQAAEAQRAGAEHDDDPGVSDCSRKATGAQQQRLAAQPQQLLGPPQS
jgi:hypothetical protein